MCGIAGIISSQRDLKLIISKMNDMQSHRGPDANGTFIADSLALGHTRLSILDLSEAGAQPMLFDHLVITYNGEIYNFKNLRSQLEANGYSFLSTCDTEVLIKAWHCWGEDCLPKLEGMFAFAILDRSCNKIFLCRDSYGVKPVFYSVIGAEFVFGSELNTVINTLAVKPEVDGDAIASFLALQFIPAPATGWKDIFKLLPGTTLIIDANNTPNIVEQKHWGDHFQPGGESSHEGSLKDIDRALAKSIEDQMVADVPVGAFLSGGVDSSLICYYASNVHKERLHTFSIGFTDVGPEHDETEYAKQAAAVINSVHHPVQIELAGIDDRINSVLNNLTELNADTSVFLTEIICEEAKKFVTVCLSGAGGDELFAGYYRHQAFLASRYLLYLPEFAVSVSQNLLSLIPQHRDSSVGNLARRLNHFLNQRTEGGNFVSMLRNDGLFTQTSAFLDNNQIEDIASALAFDFRHFLGDNIFSFTDKMSMSHSLEVRVPFLDPGVLRVAEAIPMGRQVNLCDKKISLKKLAAEYFPKNLIYRKKQGFSAPLDIWMRKYSAYELAQLCTDGIAPQFLSENMIRKMAKMFVEDKADLSTQLYSLMVLNKWAKNAGPHVVC